MVDPPRIDWQTPSNLGDGIVAADAPVDPAVSAGFEPARVEGADWDVSAAVPVPEPAASASDLNGDGSAADGASASAEVAPTTRLSASDLGDA
jgi:hypothetical protein